MWPEEAIQVHGDGGHTQTGEENLSGMPRWYEQSCSVLTPSMTKLFKHLQVCLKLRLVKFFSVLFST